MVPTQLQIDLCTGQALPAAGVSQGHSLSRHRVPDCTAPSPSSLPFLTPLPCLSAPSQQAGQQSAPTINYFFSPVQCKQYPTVSSFKRDSAASAQCRQSSSTVSRCQLQNCFATLTRPHQQRQNRSKAMNENGACATFWDTQREPPAMNEDNK